MLNLTKKQSTLTQVVLLVSTEGEELIKISVPANRHILVRMQSLNFVHKTGELTLGERPTSYKHT